MCEHCDTGDCLYTNCPEYGVDWLDCPEVQHDQPGDPPFAPAPSDPNDLPF